MRVTVLTSCKEHPVYPRLLQWGKIFVDAQIKVVTRAVDADGGDYLFLISCNEIVKASIRNRYRHALVIHASPLPKGRGWSPLVWSVLNGETRITVTMIEAEDRVDSGAIWAQQQFDIEGHELSDEMNKSLFEIELELMEYAIRKGETIVPVAQNEDEASYYHRRKPEDSRIDPERSIAEQFDLLRVCDNIRYPAFFDYRGHRYELRLTKADGSK